MSLFKILANMLTPSIFISAISSLLFSADFVSLYSTPYFVSGSGSDKNNGLDIAHPFLTIQKAAGFTNPGDTVFIMNGIYKNEKISHILIILRSGTEKAWITYIAYPGHKPQLSCNGWGGVYGVSVSYIEINGLEIIGNRDSMTYEYANSHAKSPECNGVGIAFNGNTQTNHPHHIRIINNTISKCSGSGISTCQCDYITISNNIVWGNSWYGQAGSGISNYQNWQFDTISGYKMFITRNICYDNRCLVKWVVTGVISDGNGIIIDDSKNTQNGSLLGKYTGRTLVANNVSFNNGGSGIHSYSSEHVDIVNNTIYWNAQVINSPCCNADKSNDVKIINNIIYAAPGKIVNSYSKTDTNVIYNHNIYYGGLAPGYIGEHDTVIDPKFLNPSTDPRLLDFRPRIDSYALGHGIVFPVVKTDIMGNQFSAGNASDIGAIGYKSANTSVLKDNTKTNFTIYRKNHGRQPLLMISPFGRSQPLTNAQGRFIGWGQLNTPHATGIYFLRNTQSNGK